MTVEQMRSAIIKVYPGPKWKLSVQGMDARQVIAIYKNFIRTGKFNEPKKKKPVYAEPRCEQLTIFDYLND